MDLNSPLPLDYEEEKRPAPRREAIPPGWRTGLNSKYLDAILDQGDPDEVFSDTRSDAYVLREKLRLLTENNKYTFSEEEKNKVWAGIVDIWDSKGEDFPKNSGLWIRAVAARYYDVCEWCQKNAPYFLFRVPRYTSDMGLEQIMYIFSLGGSTPEELYNIAISAVKRDRVEILHFLLENGLERTPRSVKHLFDIAAEYSSNLVLRYMLEHLQPQDVDLSSVTRDGDIPVFATLVKYSFHLLTPYLVAAKYNRPNPEIIRCLANSPSLNTNEYRFHLFLCILRIGDLPLTQRYVDASGIDGQEFPMEAVLSGNIELIRFLSQRNTLEWDSLLDNTMKWISSDIPMEVFKEVFQLHPYPVDHARLHTAIEFNRPDIFNFLLEHGYSTANEMGLVGTAVRTGNIPLTELVLKKARNKELNTPSVIYDAIRTGSIPMLEFVISRGYNPFNNKCDVVDAAILSDSLDMLKHVVKMKYDPTAGTYPNLLATVVEEREDMFLYLIEAFPNITIHLLDMIKECVNRSRIKMIPLIQKLMKKK